MASSADGKASSCKPAGCHASTVAPAKGGPPYLVGGGDAVGQRQARRGRQGRGRARARVRLHRDARDELRERRPARVWARQRLHACIGGSQENLLRVCACCSAGTSFSVSWLDVCSVRCSTRHLPACKPAGLHKACCGSLCMLCSPCQIDLFRFRSLNRRPPPGVPAGGRGVTGVSAPVTHQGWRARPRHRP